MADRDNHYERAFEKYLARLRLGCIAVDETRRVALPRMEPGERWTIKNLDFIVPLPHDHLLLIDVKGRRINTMAQQLQNWTTEGDMEGLAYWERVFGPARSTALLVFVYEVPTDIDRFCFTDHFSCDDRHYGCLAVRLDQYRQHQKVRSPKWRTVDLKADDFAAVARPFSVWVRPRLTVD